MDRLADTGQVMKMSDEKKPYSDIMNLPHHQSAHHPHMSMLNRAAQFSPYAALVGFDGVIAETARLTDKKIELSESEKMVIDQNLMKINKVIQAGHHPIITILFFVKDPYKEGGVYEKYTGIVKKIDRIEGKIVFLAVNGRFSGKSILFDDIVALLGDFVDHANDNTVNDNTNDD